MGLASMLPSEIKRVRTTNGIRVVELAALTGLPSGLIEQIEDETAVALESDLERITDALKRLIVEKNSESTNPTLKVT